MKLNRVIYADCMNEINGLPTLSDKSFDLCLTDPPYNVNYKGNSQGTKQLKRNYRDKDPFYKNWCYDWFSELKRICKLVIFTPGTPNIKMWYEIEAPRDIFIHYKPNGQGRTSCSRFNRFEQIFIYGNITKNNLFLENIFNIYLNNGFLRECKLLHPCPKSYELWYKIVDHIQPTSVLDPFLGSGTTAQVCENLKITWLGYEKEKRYKVDIDNRLRNSRKCGLERFL